MKKYFRIILWGITLFFTLISLLIFSYFLGFQKGFSEAYKEFSQAGFSFENRNLP